MILSQLFSHADGEMDEERIVKSATGIRNTRVWKKLYKFQRDGVVGAIDKLNRFGGCIIADRHIMEVKCVTASLINHEVNEFITCYSLNIL